MALIAILTIGAGLVWLATIAFSRDGAGNSVSGDATGMTTVGRLPVTTVRTPTSTAAASATTTTGTGAAVVVRRGPTDLKRVALTFDDNYEGPNATATLAVLEKYHVPATFFVIGHYVDTGPELAKAIAAGGFEVGDHTRSHCDCRTLSKHGLRIEIGNGTDHYRALTGAPTVPLFRPPTGTYDQKTLEVAAEKGFKYVVLWDIDTKDWQGKSADSIRSMVLSQATSGSIVLMHVGAPHTAEALPGIIEGLRAKGYELVALTKLLGVGSN